MNRVKDTEILRIRVKASKKETVRLGVDVHICGQDYPLSCCCSFAYMVLRGGGTRTVFQVHQWKTSDRSKICSGGKIWSGLHMLLFRTPWEQQPGSLARYQGRPQTAASVKEQRLPHL